MPEPRAGVLLVTRNFPPLRGGMERLNQRMLEGLAKREPVWLVGPRGSAEHATLAEGISEVPAAPVWRFLLGALSHSIRMAKRHHPRIVLAGSGLTAPVAWLAARLVGARAAVYLHGLDLVVESRVYQWLWLPFIRACDIAIANSRNTARLASAAGVDQRRLHVVCPGTDLPGPDAQSRAAYRNKHALGDRPLMLSVGRLTRRKGLAEFVRDVLPAILEARPKAHLVVIGADATQALTTAKDGSSELERIRDIAREAGTEHSITWLPPCDDMALSAAYLAADVHVFPVRDLPGDVEGFGMVAIEAAAHGLPTVAYSVGGIPDAVADDVSGTLVTPGDAAGFAQAVDHWLSVGSAERNRCRDHAARFSWQRLHDELASALLHPGDPAA